MKPNHETIYLVPTDYDGGQLTYSWCDCPAPGEGMDPEDATRYIRADLVPESNAVLADRIADLTRQNSGLMAQVALLRKAICRGGIMHDQQGLEIWAICPSEADKAAKLTPAQCLAEVKAQAGRDGFEFGFINGFNRGIKAGELEFKAVFKTASTTHLAEHNKSQIARSIAEEYANQLRQAAKDGE